MSSYIHVFKSFILNFEEKVEDVENSEMLTICYRFVNILTEIGFYIYGKIADILATEKANSVNFILSLIKKTPKLNTVL